jgi:transcription initiation factor IIE alpha subunit
MEDPNTSSLRCPKCGEHLVRDDANDMMNCPAHGPVGTFHQLAKAEISDILREIRESLNKAYDDDA